MRVMMEFLTIFGETNFVTVQNSAQSTYKIYSPQKGVIPTIFSWFLKELFMQKSSEASYI